MAPQGNWWAFIWRFWRLKIVKKTSVARNYQLLWLNGLFLCNCPMLPSKRNRDKLVPFACLYSDACSTIGLWTSMLVHQHTEPEESFCLRHVARGRCTTSLSLSRLSSEALRIIPLDTNSSHEATWSKKCRTSYIQLLKAVVGALGNRLECITMVISHLYPQLHIRVLSRRV